MKHKRGTLNSRVQEVANQFFGRDITIRELRLMPYIMSVCMDGIHLDYQKVNEEEIDIIESWVEKGWMDTENDTIPVLTVSEPFWKAISEIVRLSYIRHHARPLIAVEFDYGDCELWAHYSVEEAIFDYLHESGLSTEEFEDSVKTRIVSEEELANTEFDDPDYPYNAPSDCLTKFKEMTKPGGFAQSNYE